MAYREPQKRITKPQSFPDVIFNAWDKGIGNSSFIANADMRKINNKFDGVARIGDSLRLWTTQPTSGTFTADASTDILTLSTSLRPSVGTATYRAVTLSSSGTLPAGLTAGTTYFLIDVTSTTCKLATSMQNADSGTFINITDAGTGVHSFISIDPKRIRAWTIDKRTGVHYAVDVNGRVWWTYSGGLSGALYLLDGNTRTNGEGNGIVVWKNYLFVFRNAVIDYYGDLSAAWGSRAWTSSWKSLNSSSGSGNFHDSIAGVDDTVYFTDDRWVGSLSEVTTFDPATSATYTFNNQALDLPQNLVTNCLAELGSILLIGTTNDTVYPWDRVSSTYNDPLDIPTKGIYTMITVEDVTYIMAGSTGQNPCWYASNGGACKLFRSFPRQLVDNKQAAISCAVNAVAYYDGRILFGLEVAYKDTGHDYATGVWSMDLSKRSLQIEFAFSTGFGTSSGIICDSIYTYNNVIVASWFNSNDSSYGIDSNYISGFGKYAEGYVITDMRQVSVALKPRPFKQLEITLERQLESNDSVVIYWRRSLTDSFSSAFLTFSYSTFGAVEKIFVPFLLATSNIQLKISLQGPETTVATSDYKSLGVKEVRLR